MSLIVCPHCQNTLIKAHNKTYSCQQGHCFDVAKEGYLNLLPVNQKKSKAPGDNDMMIAARRHFLELGHYNPLISSVVELINETIPLDKPLTALDTGCGEGYYAQHVLYATAPNESQIIGADISKPAIKLASKKYKDSFFFVSSVYNLPVANQCIDLILSVFAPVHAPEFHRVLASNGYLIVVGPGENHHKELAQLIYNEFRPHQNKITSEMPSDFKFLKTKLTTFDITIDDAEVLLMLLKMTPYYWNTSKEALAKLQACNHITIQCDFNISIFQKIDL